MKQLIDLYYRYENELEVMLPQFKQELADLLFQSTTTTKLATTNKPENVSKNKTPHFTTDFAAPLSRHDAPKNETTKTTQLDVCQNCFERHSLAFRLCRNCGEEHDGCCEIMVS